MGKKSRRQKMSNPKIVQEQPVNYKRIDGTPDGEFNRGWGSHADCLAFCQEQYPDIPIDMIELAMSYCERHPDTKEKWSSIPSVNIPLTGKMRRKLEKNGKLEAFLAEQDAHNKEMAKKTIINDMISVYTNPKDAPVYPLGKGVPDQDKMKIENECSNTGEGFSLGGRIWTPNQDGYEEAKELYEKEQKKISTITINE